MRFFRRNAEEIARDPALRFYGAILALLHVLAFLHWELVHPLAKILDPSLGPAVCWPFWEDCHAWHVFSPAQVEAILRGYLVLAIATMVLFFRPAHIPTAWWSLLILNVLKSLILFQDYRLRLNQHYMTFWVTFVFLFLPGKRQVLRYLIASFYFWAGTLKFTPDWISGIGLYGKKPLGVPESLIPASCVYVIFLELVMVFGLLVRNRWIFWGALIQFIAFHIASWPIVNFFYPTMMLAILSIFLLARYIPDPLNPEEKPPLALNFRRLVKGKEPVGVYLVVGIFGFFQFIPYAFPGDSSFTGEGRVFALHMFDAPLECNAWATLHHREGTEQEVAVFASLVPPRIICDPVVYFSLGKDLCRKIASEKQIVTMDLHLQTRRSGKKEFLTVIEQPDFCHSGLHYDIWRSNSWILRRPK